MIQGRTYVTARQVSIHALSVYSSLLQYGQRMYDSIEPVI